MTIWIDVTTSASAHPPATGISRVELNLAEAMCEASPDIALFLYEAQLGRFSALPRSGLERIGEVQRSSAAVEGRMELEVERRDMRHAGGIEIFGRGDVLIERSAVAFQVLELPGARVARSHQHKDTAPARTRARQKRLDGVAAKVRIDRQRIGVPHRPAHALQHGAGKGRISVRLGRRGNVVALAVENGDQSGLPGAAGLPQHQEAERAPRAAPLRPAHLPFDPAP